MSIQGSADEACTGRSALSVDQGVETRLVIGRFDYGALSPENAASTALVAAPTTLSARGLLMGTVCCISEAGGISKVTVLPGNSAAMADHAGVGPFVGIGGTLMADIPSDPDHHPVDPGSEEHSSRRVSALTTHHCRLRLRKLCAIRPPASASGLKRRQRRSSRSAAI
jgi:hypothetical protein